LPTAMTFEPNKQYVRDVLAAQIGYRADGVDIEDRNGKLTALSKEYQSVVNGDGNYSQDVIDLHVERFGEDYRLQPEGDHPVDGTPASVGARSGARR